MSCGPIMELIIYVGVYFMSFPLSLKHIRDSYRDRTGKMRSFFEVRFMSKQIFRVLQPLFPSLVIADVIFGWPLNIRSIIFFPPHFQAVRPLVSFFLAMAACLAWALYSPNDVFRSDVRCFFYMSGTLYANMSCRLIVAQGG